jgi:hypothetical protein
MTHEYHVSCFTVFYPNTKFQKHSARPTKMTHKAIPLCQHCSYPVERLITMNCRYGPNLEEEIPCYLVPDPNNGDTVSS